MNNLLYKNGKLSKNKFWELQVMWCKDWTWFKLNIEMTRKCDHQGFRFSFEIYKLDFEFMVCDNRHWDYTTNDFEKYEKYEKYEKS